MSTKKYKGLNVYFSASSSDLNSRKKLYISILDSIKLFGARLTYDWLNDKEKLKPSEIYEKASEAIKNADVVVAEITYPSTGVGQQIGLALSWKIPVIAIHQLNNPDVSRFAVGMESPYLQVKEYNQDKIESVLDESFASVMNKQFERFNFISTREINDYLSEHSSRQNISKSQLLRRIIREWMSKNSK